MKGEYCENGKGVTFIQRICLNHQKNVVSADDFCQSFHNFWIRHFWLAETLDVEGANQNLRFNHVTIVGAKIVLQKKC